MSANEIAVALNRLHELRSAVDVMQAEKSMLIDGVLTPEIKQQIAEIELEYSGHLDAANASISDLENMIKAEVLAYGATVKGAHIMAVWNKGRVSWDTKALDGYVVAHPELANLRKTGDPTVTLRTT